jgi:hypothetical protein
MTGLEAAKAWIQLHAKPRKTFNRRITSYGLKHVAEKAYGVYIANEEFIQAMDELGFSRYQSRLMRGGPNFYFNAGYTGTRG